MHVTILIVECHGEGGDIKNIKSGKQMYPRDNNIFI